MRCTACRAILYSFKCNRLKKRKAEEPLKSNEEKIVAFSLIPPLEVDEVKQEKRNQAPNSKQTINHTSSIISTNK